ncbi:bifunctional protein GlmU-like isoform X2 [Mauremys mutica]|uniref:bifunctional protein GlmU-like isoform X2 n=1 Tax=Mauremys mutica TaxID=74926 RepID=UPI001D16C6CC|nr:bifunctional protein GlmU-like isoform X2 [Mauremys mutica]
MCKEPSTRGTEYTTSEADHWAADRGNTARRMGGALWVRSLRVDLLERDAVAAVSRQRSITSRRQAGPSAFSVYALRLGPGEDIVTSLLHFVEDKKLKAPFVMTCVGSITKATLRLANTTASNTNQIIHLNERFEIVSLVGTLNKAPHLHICLSDKDGKTVGGHVISDLEVFTTAEIVIGECTGLQFTREMDDRTGFPELVISSRSEKEGLHHHSSSNQTHF